MIGYACKYTPVELICAHGGEVVFLNCEYAAIMPAVMVHEPHQDNFKLFAGKGLKKLALALEHPRFEMIADYAHCVCTIGIAVAAIVLWSIGRGEIAAIVGAAGGLAVLAKRLFDNLSVGIDKLADNLLCAEEKTSASMVRQSIKIQPETLVHYHRPVKPSVTQTEICSGAEQEQPLAG